MMKDPWNLIKKSAYPLIVLLIILVQLNTTPAAPSAVTPSAPPQGHVPTNVPVKPYAFCPDPVQPGHLCVPGFKPTPVKTSTPSIPGNVVAIHVRIPTNKPGAKPADAGTYLPVTPGIAGLVEGWTEVNTSTCEVVDTGSYSVTNTPTHGEVNFGLANLVSDGPYCVGLVLLFNAAYYTWTDPDTSAGQDPFSLEWDSECCSESGSWDATLTALQPGESDGDMNSPDAPPGSCGCGDPIDVGTGNVYYSVTDYTSNGVNPLDFTRYYNSRTSASPYAISLGGNWRDTYDRYLKVASSTSVTGERADGEVLSFTLNGSFWQTDSDIDLTLTHSGSGTGSTWTLKGRDGTVETYTQLSTGEGLLSTIKALDGYTQTIHYNGANQLTSVTDSFNRTLTFTYQNGLLSTFTTPDGLVITYGYSSSGLNPGVNDQFASISYSDTQDQWLYTYLSLGFLLNIITDTSVITFDDVPTSYTVPGTMINRAWHQRDRTRVTTTPQMHFL